MVIFNWVRDISIMPERKERKQPKSIKFKVGSVDLHTRQWYPDPRYPGVGEHDYVEIRIKEDS